MTVRGRIAPRTVLQAVAATGMRGQLISNAGDSGSLALHDDRRSRALVTCATPFRPPAHSPITRSVRAVSRAPLDLKGFGCRAGAARGPPVVSRRDCARDLVRPASRVAGCAGPAARHEPVDGGCDRGSARARGVVRRRLRRFLFAVSLWLEAWSVGRARRAIGALLDLSPMVVGSHARRRDRNAVGVVAVRAVVVVRPGAHSDRRSGRRRPGEVEPGPISGESVPVAKGPGDALYAGTVNGIGALEMRTTRRFEDSTVARIFSPDSRRARGVSVTENGSIGSRGDTRRPSWRSPSCWPWHLRSSDSGVGRLDLPRASCCW